MEILNHKDERTLLTVVQHEVSQECKGPDLTFLRTEVHQQRVIHRHVEKLEQQGRPILWQELSGLQIPPDFCCDDLLSISLGDTASLAEQVTHWEIGGDAAIWKAVSFPVEHRLASQTAVEFCEQP